jgi:hypothetical protein
LRGALYASLPQHVLSRGGNLELPDIFIYEIASLRSQRRLKDFFNNLLTDAGLPGDSTKEPRLLNEWFNLQD